MMENRENDHYHDERNMEQYNFEFLIRRVRDYDFSDDFDLSKIEYKNVLTPNTIEFSDFKELEYQFCEYKVLGAEVSIASEFSGIHIIIDSNGIEREIVKKVIQEIRDNIQNCTNHQAQIFEV